MVLNGVTILHTIPNILTKRKFNKEKKYFHQIISTLTSAKPELILKTDLSIIIRAEARLSLRKMIFVGGQKQGNIVQFTKDVNTVNDDSEFQHSCEEMYSHELQPYQKNTTINQALFLLYLDITLLNNQYVTGIVLLF